jgi:uncharacterized protein YjbI with pentapeptide repeats
MEEPRRDQRCKYKCDSTGWKCPRQALPDSGEGFCICHEQRDDKDEALFRKEIKAIVDKAGEETCSFEGFYFPVAMDFEKVSFQHNVYFNEATFNKNVSFNEAKFHGEYISFFRVRFAGKNTSFMLAQFSGNRTSFVEARFASEYTTFLNAQFSGVYTSFWSAQFTGEETGFRMAQFTGEKVTFSMAQFSGNKIDFSYAHFQYTLDLYATRFECDENLLSELILGKSANLLLSGTIFRERNINDLSKLDLSKCVLRESHLDYCDLSMIQLNWNIRLLNETLNTEDYRDLGGYMWVSEERKAIRYNQAAASYRILKINFDRQKDHNNAAICHYREWECKRKTLNWQNPKEFLPWLFHLLLNISCGYGEKLQNVFATIATLLIVYPFLFIIPGFQLCPGGEGLSPVEGMSRWWGESAITHWWWGFKHTLFNFFPLWRLDDIKACTDPARLATGFIALVGAFMIGMFIYVFRRRLMR